MELIIRLFQGILEMQLGVRILEIVSIPFVELWWEECSDFA